MIKIGCLLWIDEKNHSAVNNKNKKVTSYFKQIDLLAKTLFKKNGFELILFSNKIDVIKDWFNLKNKTCPNLIEIFASYSVPAGTPFYGAHYKLEALAAGKNLLATSTDRFILLDADVVSLEKFSDIQLDFIQSADLILYDITEQLAPTYGVKLSDLSHDIELIAEKSFMHPIWYGGEFICGSAQGLDRLLLEAHKVLPLYLENINKMHHVGDEMFVSAALNVICMQPNSLIIIDQSRCKLISRHWSRFALPSIDWHMQHSLLHCPGNKPLLEILSMFKNPSSTPICALLKIYSWFVRAYQSLKKFRIKFS